MRRIAVIDVTPGEVANLIEDGKAMLVDVRELHEVAAERYPGAIVVPLSRFDVSQIPDPEGRQVVFACAGGVRSRQASEIAQLHGLPYDLNLAGGLKAWKEAGLPTER
jgi:rhodanese-related sulfurtransferase